ncbi:hypothetical protein EH230_05160 [Flavobacterium columnare]|uniref:Uncharacterized protein n=1 Tax=Flavobacterium columnare TaxID=996 RepID=A0A437U9R1_9FLAO|nr:hypothetical protein [Flavobacterium columnare]RVU90335.1 hypothetical protein EH230_05160 [Flavobacterium columnare]
MMINKIILILLLSIILSNCGSKKPDINDEYREYQIARGENPKDKRPFQHFENFLAYKDSIKKQNLLDNPFLKVNQVYVHYRTPNSVEFSVYSDKETFCLSDYDLDMDGKILSLPDENGIVKVVKPIIVKYFGDFEITNNIIKTRRHSRSPFAEWYDYVEGKISNDTIYLSKKYWGKAKKNYKFKKYWLAKTRKTNIKEIYQPNLKAVKYKNKSGLTCFEVTGEFSVE